MSLVDALPDEPRWLEAQAIAADPASWRRALGGGLAVGSDGARLIAIVGDADPAALRALAADHPDHTLLAAREDLARATGREIIRARLHTLPDDALADLPDLEGAMPLPEDAALDHVPAPLAAELAHARRARTVWTAYVDGAPVSFAYAPWRTARWFDVSVDTVPGARQLGLGRLVAIAMIRDEHAHGRAPVWGANDDNAASLRLARSLGFVEVDALWVAA
jgi:hypothetical protein